jgi:hypothetical protein
MAARHEISKLEFEEPGRHHGRYAEYLLSV